MASLESLYGHVTAQIMVGLPAAIVSVPPLVFRSTPDHTHPLRTFDLLGAPNFFDHSGNCVNGSIAAMAIIFAGQFIEDHVPSEKQRATIILTSAAAAIGSIGVNVAYEAGVAVPLTPQKPHDAPFDAGDALYGGITGVLFSAVFCVSALRQRHKANNSYRREQALQV